MNFTFQINVIVHKLFTFFMTLTYIGIPVIFYYARSHNSGFVNWYKWMIPTYIITIVLCIIIKWIRQIISRFIRDRIIHHFNDLSKSWGIQPINIYVLERYVTYLRIILNFSTKIIFYYRSIQRNFHHLDKRL